MKYTLTVVALSCLLSTAVKSQTLKDAIRLNENEQQEEADSMYKQLISKEPNNGTYYYYAGENMLDAANVEEAEKYFSEGLAKDPAQPLLQVAQAELLIQKSQLQE